MSSRTLSKSDFKLARTCGAKLYFRENRYPDNRDSNAYMAMLAEGGYMVEALAKASFPDGVQLEYGHDVTEDYERTLGYLQRDAVTLFEATLLVGRRQARVDVLEKRGNVVRLLEIKAKSASTDRTTRASCWRMVKTGVMRHRPRKPFGVRSERGGGNRSRTSLFSCWSGSCRA